MAFSQSAPVWLRLDALVRRSPRQVGFPPSTGDLLCSGQELSFRADKPGFSLLW